MSRKTFLLAVLCLSLAGCKKSDTITQPPPEPPGLQHVIPWPSLANSPWPMNHGNPQSTGRSRLDGPVLGQLIWQGIVPWRSEAGVVVTSDSLLVTGQQFTAFRPDGTLRWATVPAPPGDPLVTTPIVTRDKSIIAATNGGLVYCVDSTGTSKWVLPLGEQVFQQGTNLGIDGTFYCVSGAKTLFAVNPDGTLRWRLTDSRFSGGERSVLTISPDGGTIYVPGEGVTVNAVDLATQQVKWRFGTSSRLDLAPIVDSDGNIYVLGVDSVHYPKPSLISLRPDGSVRWAFVHNNTFDQMNAGDPTIDANGNVYFGLDTLYAVGPTGSLRWKRGFGEVGSKPSLDPPLVCDEAGRVYCIVWDQATSKYAAFALNSNGIAVWSFTFPSTYIFDSSPALLWGNSLAIAGISNQQLYFIR